MLTRVFLLIKMAHLMAYDETQFARRITDELRKAECNREFAHGGGSVDRLTIYLVLDVQRRRSRAEVANGFHAFCCPPDRLERILNPVRMSERPRESAGWQARYQCRIGIQRPCDELVVGRVHTG